MWLCLLTSQLGVKSLPQATLTKVCFLYLLKLISRNIFASRNVQICFIKVAIWCLTHQFIRCLLKLLAFLVELLILPEMYSLLVSLCYP
ncbi:hypothetical protein AKJ16_DCAP19239 [Drosera capensis]